MKKNTFRHIMIAAMLLISSFSLTACGNRPDANGSMKSEDGRKYGGLIEAKSDEVVHTVFFDMKVNSSKKCSTYQFQDGLYAADSGKSYLEVEVTITNTYDKDLPMSISDFTLDYSENENKDIITGYGITELGIDGFMDNIFTLKQGESITKSILFIVDDRAEYLLCYKEFYEDKFEGDSYEITLVPETLEPAVTTEAATEAASEETTEAVTEEPQAETEETSEEEQAEENVDTGIDEE